MIGSICQFCVAALSVSGIQSEPPPAMKLSEVPGLSVSHADDYLAQRIQCDLIDTARELTLKFTLVISGGQRLHASRPKGAPARTPVKYIFRRTDKRADTFEEGEFDKSYSWLRGNTLQLGSGRLNSLTIKPLIPQWLVTPNSYADGQKWEFETGVFFDFITVRRGAGQLAGICDVVVSKQPDLTEEETLEFLAQ